MLKFSFFSIETNITFTYYTRSRAEVLNFFCLIYPLPNEKSKIYPIILVAPCEKWKVFFLSCLPQQISKQVFLVNEDAIVLDGVL